MYALGVDLGTTYTAAATWRDGRAEIVSLGSRAATIPSVVLLREDGSYLVGEAASRRGLSEPDRVAREFKRRLGDPTPILLGGAPYSAEALMGRLLSSVIDDITDREGGPPSAICLSHPANWGPYKTDLLRQAVRQAGIEQPVTYTTEPEAAATFYAHQQRIQPGAIVAVYDLGGGTFDAAILRKTTTGFEILGQPEGIERLGGIDIDAAVFRHVRHVLGSTLEDLDEDDPTTLTAVARLREECVTAKELLSADTDTAIPAVLPGSTTEVRLTRAELEEMARPALHPTIEALHRALHSAAVPPHQLHCILLVGGTSRMPLVAQLVAAELDRPVTTDAHPKHAIALGAATHARDDRAQPATTATVAAPPPPHAPPARQAPPAPAAPPGGPPAGPLPPPTTRTTPTAGASAAPTTPFARPSPALAGRASVPPPRQPTPAEPAAGNGGTGRTSRRWLVILAAAAGLILLGTGSIALAMRDSSGGGEETPSPSGTTASPSPTSPSPTASPSPTTPDETDDPPSSPPTTSPPPPSPTASPTPTPSPTPSVVQMPSVVGLGWSNARAQLANEGLSVRAFCPLAAPDAPVTSQTPAPGAEVATGSQVTIRCQ